MVLITAICIVFPNKDHKRRAECIDVREIDMQKQKSIFAESNFMPKSPSTWRCVRLAPPFKTFDSAFSKLSKTLQHIPLNQIPPNSDTDFSHGAMCNTSDLLFHAITPPRPTPDLFFDQISIPQIPFTSIPDSLPLNPLTVKVTHTWHFEGGLSQRQLLGFDKRAYLLK